MENGSASSSIMSEIAGEALAHVTALPGWSLLAHIFVGVTILGLQQTVRGSRQFSDWNEFLCTAVWVYWSLETAVIAFASSSLHANFTLFLRLLLWPAFFQDACVNPLNSIFLAVQRRSVRHLPRCLAIQLVAMGTGVAYSALSWWVMGSWLSLTHLNFLSSRASPFLNVSVTEGFLLELAMSFAMYLPRLILKAGFVCTFVSAVQTCVMILCLEHTTGAFMNPLIALSVSLLWHPLSLPGLWELALVYWLGPIIGTVLVARLQLWVFSEKVHSS